MTAAHFPILAAGCVPRHKPPRQSVEVVPHIREPRIDRASARALRATGMSIREIASIIGASDHWTSRLVAGAAPPGFRSGFRRRRFDHDEAARLRETGMHYSEIGHLLGVSAPAIHQALNPRKRDRRTS